MSGYGRGDCLQALLASENTEGPLYPGQAAVGVSLQGEAQRSVTPRGAVGPSHPPWVDATTDTELFHFSRKVRAAPLGI